MYITIPQNNEKIKITETKNLLQQKHLVLKTKKKSPSSKIFVYMWTAPKRTCFTYDITPGEFKTF